MPCGIEKSVPSLFVLSLAQSTLNDSIRLCVLSVFRDGVLGVSKTCASGLGCQERLGPHSSTCQNYGFRTRKIIRRGTPFSTRIKLITSEDAWELIEFLLPLGGRWGVQIGRRKDAD